MLKKKYRLTKRSSFSYVYKSGAKKGGRSFKIVFIKSRTLKIGFSVSNKIGNAVVRNKLKRRLRAVFIKLTPRLKPVQLIVTAFPSAESLAYAAVEAEIISLLSASGLLA